MTLPAPADCTITRIADDGPAVAVHFRHAERAYRLILPLSPHHAGRAYTLASVDGRAPALEQRQGRIWSPVAVDWGADAATFGAWCATVDAQLAPPTIPTIPQGFDWEPDVRNGIVPISFAQTRLAACIRQAQTTGRPVVVTQKGYPTAVLLSIGQYEALEKEIYDAALDAGADWTDAQDEAKRAVLLISDLRDYAADWDRDQRVMMLVA